MKIFSILIAFVIILITSDIYGQYEQPDVRNMKKKEILSLTTEQLANLTFEDIVYISNKLGISIDDLLDASVSISSKTELTPRETPGIISIITSNDIEKSGASDLVDIIRTIPGMYFGYDVDGVVGIFMRGNWGVEGKVLFMIDDMELNEGLYSIVPLINQIPAEQINRVEVIRGPGSALYGGYAELGVIRVVTKNGSDLKGVEVSGNTGVFKDGISRTGAHFGFGNDNGKSVYSFQATWNQRDRAAGDFTNFFGDTYEMGKGWSDTEQLQIMMNYKSGGFNGNLFMNRYSFVPTGYEGKDDVVFSNIMSKLSYTFQPSVKLKITPGIFYKSQNPYSFSNESWTYKRNVAQYLGNVDFIWMPAKPVQILFGGGYKIEDAKIKDKERNIVGENFYNDKNKVTHKTAFFYTQGSYSSEIGNFFAGIRYENHSVTESSFAPRLGYTKVLGNFNLKYLYSHAFRSPSIENINSNPDIDPERTIVNELELGYRINDNFFISSGFFDIVIKDPIVYFYDIVQDIEYYWNTDKTGTTGLEVELKAVFEKWNGSLSYSHYNASRNNKTEFYKVYLVDREKSQFLKGAPAHMIHLNTSFQATENFFISPVVSYYSKRYGFINDITTLEKADQYLLADLTFLWRNTLTKGLDVTLSIRNILNEKYSYIQPYGMADMADAPYPGSPLETLLKIKYKF